VPSHNHCGIESAFLSAMAFRGRTAETAMTHWLVIASGGVPEEAAHRLAQTESDPVGFCTGRRQPWLEQTMDIL